MFDYKQEINKYQPLPEPKQAQKIVENNDVSDIIDILKQLYFRTNKG
ncbi:MAG: hypothetical protein ACI4VF_06430 [Lachnospirales bacterium]